MEPSVQATLILLDCHKDALTRPVILAEETGCTLWTCFVEGALEYCRIVFDLFEDAAISIHVAGTTKELSILSDWHVRNVNEIANNFKYIPSQILDPFLTRMEQALENAVRSLISYNPRSMPTQMASSTPASKRVRVIWIVMGKGGEREFDYCETEGALPSFDLCQLIRAVFRRVWSSREHRDGLPLDHCHFDIIRVVPPYQPLPNDMPWTRIGAITYNGASCSTTPPVAYVATKRRPDEANTKVSYEINLLYHTKQHVLYTDADILEETKQVNRRIYEENFLSERRNVIKWCKRKNQEHDMIATECIHRATPLDISQLPTVVFTQNLVSGIIIPSSKIGVSDDTPPSLKESTHVIAFHNDTIYVHCLAQSNEGKYISLERATPPKVLLPRPKALVATHINQCVQSIIRPNIITSVENQQIYDTIDNSITVLDTAELNDQFSTEPGVSNANTIVTSSAALEMETRWWKGLLTGNVDVGWKLLIGLGRPVQDRPGQSAQKNTGDGKGPVIEQLAALRSILCTENPPLDYIQNMNKIIDRLLTMQRGQGTIAFESQKLAVSLLKQTRVLGEMFKNKSKKHSEIYTLLTSRIKPDGTENKTISLSPQSQQTGSPGSYSARGSRYYPYPKRGQSSRGRGGRAWNHSGSGDEGRKTPPIKVVPTPYLRYIPVTLQATAEEEEIYKERLGNEGLLFSRYWTLKRESGKKRKELDARIPISKKTDFEIKRKKTMLRMTPAVHRSVLCLAVDTGYVRDGDD
ncbi:7770_t:CDS:10 [Paraglomus brasilianum]|uniref:7770_t:CDS:1 n=1 Tax=Paraglomus brasilianum TaxID=144538 RepID=A0A9N9F9V6_9GLOM|nr:7770_t:CDS:10 [Paraglomus brasilianum]